MNNKSTVLFSILLMAIIAMMIVPVPAILLDFGLALSFSLAILIFTLTLFVERPLDFSSFPTILLASLVLRLSLNVSSTKLIIGDGHTGIDAAGDVIAGFAQFVMSGDTFIGIVVFCVLLIVNFMVVTKGAARMAEVSARFALDGMPGKQLAIDSDMSAGAIDHNQAKERREREQAETTFFGSLDGASKFVKGDAIAGLLITVLNLAAGLFIGIFAHGMQLGTAFETYAILTVGDGLVSQIPAVIISIATALLLARGGSTGATDKTVFKQMSRHPVALMAVSVLLFAFALLPGLPFLPFTVGGAALLALSILLTRQSNVDRQAETEATLEENVTDRTTHIADVLELDDLHIEFAPDLVEMALDLGTGLEARISNMRGHIVKSFGVILPEVRLTDNHVLEEGVYVIKIHGVEVTRGKLIPNKFLALLPNGSDNLPQGVDVKDPVYSAPARWLDSDSQERAAMLGVTIVTPAEVLATHLMEVVKQNLGRLFNLKALHRLLEEVVQVSAPDRASSNRKLLNEIIPEKVSLETLHAVLKLLLEEKVSIRNLPLILEAIVETRGVLTRPEAICEHVRQSMGFQIVSELKREDGSVPLVQLAPEWEQTFEAHQIDVDNSIDVALPPDVFSKLGDSVSEKMSEVQASGQSVALVTNSKRRRFLKTLLRAKGVNVPVLSFEEVGIDTRPTLVGVVPA